MTDTTSAGLAPCPFCGAAPRIWNAADDPAAEAHEPAWAITCTGDDCLCVGFVGYTRERCIELWSSRPQPAGDVAGLVERLIAGYTAWQRASDADKGYAALGCVRLCQEAARALAALDEAPPAREVELLRTVAKQAQGVINIIDTYRSRTDFPALRKALSDLSQFPAAPQPKEG